MKEGRREGVGKSLFTFIVATHCWKIPASLCPPLPCPVPTAWWTQTTDCSLKRDLWSMREREEGVRSRGREREGRDGRDGVTEGQTEGAGRTGGREGVLEEGGKGGGRDGVGKEEGK